MKKTGIVAGVLLLLALDWAALHDILKGEANTTVEYTFIAFSLGVFFFLYLRVFKKL